MRKPWYHILYVRSPILKILFGIIGVMATVALVLFQFYTEEPRMAAQAANWNGRSIEKGAELYANNCSSCHGMDGKGLPNVAPALDSKYFFTQRMADVGWSGTMADYVELTLIAGRPSKVGTQWAQIMPTWSSEVGGPLRSDQILQLVNYVMNWQDAALAQTAAEDPFQCFKGVPTKAGEGDKSPDALQIKTCLADGTSFLPGEPVPTPQPEDTSAGPRDPAALFVSTGCVGCHNLNLDQTADALGQPGPHMRNLAENAAQRVAGEDAVTYVHTSIVNPGAYVVPGYINGIMPANFADQMSEEEINNLVAWILDPNRQQ